MKNSIIKIMDTTLRDGEQTTGVSFTASEKLTITKLLLSELNVDHIEVASARVSKGEFEGVSKITSWAKEAGQLDKIEILGFVDGVQSLEWIQEAGGRVVNLLCKGSLSHVKGQLRKTPKEHVEDIKEVVKNAREMGIRVNIYLEDWSNGMRNSSDYVLFLLDELRSEKIERYMLPDTLGVLNPQETSEYCHLMLEKYPELQFDFHAHNDYDLAIGNVMEAIKAGIKCVHTTVNGLGERAGNAPISSVVAVIEDQLHLKSSINEKHLSKVSKIVESFSGIRIPANKPLIGEFVFTQCSGVHADGDQKANLYQNDLKPERFGRQTTYALGKTSGKSNILKNLETLGLTLDKKSIKKVTDKVIELGDLKKTVTIDDLPYIVADVLRNESISDKIKITKYVISLSKGMSPSASVLVSMNGEKHEAVSGGDGQYDAFMNALKKIYSRQNKELPQLMDYSVTIPPGGNTDALVETTITWKLGREFKTRGLEPDQTTAAIVATEKMLNVIENSYLSIDIKEKQKAS